MALLTRGIAVPDDVKVVAFANAGFAPVFPKSLTRIEHDPFRCGVQAAEFILAVLSKGRIPAPPVLAPTYIVGETFPY